MCGIFGWAGKRPQDFNKAKFDILGLFNIARGKHSCGVSTDGDIFIGVDSTKEYHDFLANSNYLEPQHYPYAIGHTRHATGGAHNVDNAHPFGFGSVEDGYEFIGVHNGKLHNESDLAEKYEVKERVRKEEKNVVSWRDKIDSEILLEIVYKNKDFKVLNEYRGAAALVFINLNEPNTMYFYHGKSKKTYYDKELTEERPLFYWQESKNSLYVSSIEKSLVAIGGTEATIKEFEHNKVYKVVNGDVSTAKKFIVKREENQQSDYVPKDTTYQRNNNVMQNQKHGCGYPPNGGGANCNVGKQSIIPLNAHLNKDKEMDKEVDNIYNDEPIGGHNAHGGKLYVNKLRYYRNGHTVTGIYAYVPKAGFYYLSDKIKDAHNRFYDIVNKYFDPKEHDFVRAITQFTKEERKRLFIPFNFTEKNEADFPQLYYFYDGVRLQTELDYNACIENKPGFNWEALSICSVHPVCDIKPTWKRADQQNILLDGKPATETVAPLGSGKVYHIINGNCKIIKTQEESNIESLKKIEDAVDKIQKHEKEVLESELKEIESHPDKADFDADLLEKDLEHFFNQTLKMFPSYVKRLKEYKGSDRADKAKEILEVFVESASKLMTVDITE